MLIQKYEKKNFLGIFQVLVYNKHTNITNDSNLKRIRIIQKLSEWTDCGPFFDRNNMGWKTVIIGCESKVSLTLNRMKITIGNEYQNIALCDIDTVIFSHNRVVMTVPLLSELIKNNINIIVCDERNDPIGIFQAFNGHSLVFKQLKKQMEWKITRKKKLWKMIIEEKLQSEIDVLKILSLSPSTVVVLSEYRNTVYSNDETNREAIGAKIYFSALFGEDFSRSEENEINYALNYGYKIIASYISKCIASRGFLTQLGIHHIGESNPFNLTYDFIEPFRAIVDLWVWLNVKEKFTLTLRKEIVGLLNYKVCIGHKWIRLCDGIEDILDSYISFLDDRNTEILIMDLSQGLRESD